MASSSAATAQIAQQLQQSTHAWNTITATLAAWQPANSAAAASTAAPAAAAPLPPAATLRSAYAVLHSLHLDSLLRAHILDELLAPFLRARVIAPWWSHVDSLLVLQHHYFSGRASAPARFHAVLSRWIVQGFTQMVEQIHQVLQPLYTRLRAIDTALIDPAAATVAVAPSLYLDARRLLHTLFTASLAAPCSSSAASAASSSAASPLSPPRIRRESAMEEYLFKYYRVNFRVFSRVTRQRALDAAAEEEPQEEEEEAEAEEEPAVASADAEADLNASSMSDSPAAAASSSSSAPSAAAIIAAATALPKLQYDEATLARFARTCSLLLEMHFLGSSDQAPASASSGSSSAAAASPASTAASAAAAAIPPLLPSSLMLDFFFVLLGKYLRAPGFKGVWDRDQLGPLRRWMDRQVLPFLHVVVTGRERSGGGTEKDDPQFLHYSSLLHSSFLSSFGALRIREELFSIVLDYPDSLWSLRNLHEILPQTKQAPLVVSALSEGFSRRLLRPGTNTKQILEQYVHLISAVRVLDPVGRASMLAGILQASGVAQYIRARADTTRMIVQALWGSTEQQKDHEDAEEDEEEEEEAAAEEEKGAEAEESKMHDAAPGSAAAASSSAAPSLPPLLGASPLFDASADAAAAAAAGDLGLDLSHELEIVPDDTQFGDDSDGEADEAATVAAAAAASSSEGGSAHVISRIDFHPSDLWSPEIFEPGAGDLGAPATSAGGGGESASAAKYLRQADILSLLIDLCGSGERNEELLLVEYKQFMAERFLSKRSNQGEPPAPSAVTAKGKTKQRSVIDLGQRNPLFDCELELTHVERMKLRFGTDGDGGAASSGGASSHANSSISELEIMMKDIANSKRIQNQIVGAGSNVGGGGSAAAAEGKKSMLVQALLDRAERLQSSEEEADRSLYAAELSAGTLAASLELASRFSVLVLSSEFWPGGEEMGRECVSGSEDAEAEPEIAFKMPRALAAVREAYQSVFHTLKEPRVLHWGAGAAANASIASGASSAGSGAANEVGADIVELELEMRDGRLVRVECQPIHAAILEAFAEPPSASAASASSSAAEPAAVERTQWSLSDLAAHLECDDEEALAGKMQFWVQKGLLRLVAAPRSAEDAVDDSAEEPQMVYELVEHASALDDAEGDGGGAGGSGSDDTSALSAKQKGSQDALVETYMLGALNNFASMSVAQLHHMLKLFNVPGFLYTHTEAELKVLLQSLQQRGILSFQDGLYTRAKALRAE